MTCPEKWWYNKQDTDTRVFVHDKSLAPAVGGWRGTVDKQHGVYMKLRADTDKTTSAGVRPC